MEGQEVPEPQVVVRVLMVDFPSNRYVSARLHHRLLKHHH